MTITSITYRRLINTGNYENLTFEMSATVAPEEDIAVAAMELRATVHAAIRDALERRPGLYRGDWPDLFPRDEPEPIVEVPGGD